MKKHKLLFTILGSFALILITKALAISTGTAWILSALVALVTTAVIAGIFWVTGVFKWIKKLLG